MLLIRNNGATSNVFRVTLRHSSTGAGLTGLTEASAGLIIATICDNEAATTRYRAGSSEIETISTLGTFEAPTSGKCRFKEVDSTNHPGLYEIQLADARFAVSSAKVLKLHIIGATNLLTKEVTIQLTTANVMDIANLPANLTQWRGSTPANLTDTDKVPASVQHMGNNTLTAAAAAADFGAEVAALVETYIVNEGDATAVMQAIANLIAADWVAGDASPLAIVAALKADAQWSNLATMAAELAKVPKSDSNVTWNATALASINAQADLALTDYDPPTNAEMEVRTLPAASYATAAALSTLAAIFSGITSLAQWLGSMAGKQTPDSTAQTEMRATGAGSGTFAASNDSLEAIRERGDAAWTGGGGGGPVAVSVAIPKATARAILAADGTIGVTAGDTLRVSFEGDNALGDLSGRDKLVFTVKRSRAVDDDDAIIQITEADGLVRLNGAAPGSAAWGVLTVLDAVEGEVDITLYASATALLAARIGALWDIKQFLDDSPDDAVTVTEGTLDVTAGITQATT